MNKSNEEKIITDGQWKIIKDHFTLTMPGIARLAIRYYSIATTNSDGTPHIAPIGSVFLTEKNRGIYFEGFSAKTSGNLKRNKNICVMAVNVSKRFWFGIFVKGKISAPIGIRLNGTAGPRRKATQDETEYLRQIFPAWFKRFKGSDYIIGRLGHVRDIDFHSFDNVKAGEIAFNF